MNWKKYLPLCFAAAFLAVISAALNIAAARVVLAQTSAAKLNWVSYTDNAEGAFSMDVPVGYEVQGGMYRFGYFDVRWMMEARSLDGKIIIRINDVNVPPYTMPGPQTGREGSRNFRPQQYQMMVARFRDGQNYAESYAKNRFSKTCTTMNPRTVAWTPTFPAEMKDAPGTRFTDGSVSYDCDSSDGPRIADVFVHTNVNPEGTIWFALPVSILASPDRAAFAHSMVDRMIGSWKKNPEWVQRQNQITQEGLAQIGRDFGAFMQQMRTFHQQREAAMNQQVAGYYAKQNAQAQQVSSWGQTLTGLEDIRDPNTGNKYEVFTGPKANQYINDAGTIVNSNLSPGPGYRVAPVVPH